MSISYLDVSFANVTAEECFGLQPSSAQVACSAQHLNITDPPRRVPAAAAARAAARRGAAALPARSCRTPRAPGLRRPCSYYSFEEYPFLWEPITCMLSNVSYHNRIDIPGAHGGGGGGLGCVGRGEGMMRLRPAAGRRLHPHVPPAAAACLPPADNFNWCTIPLKGSDAFLFVSLALIIAACLFGKLSAVWVLVAGARG